MSCGFRALGREWEGIRNGRKPPHFERPELGPLAHEVLGPQQHADYVCLGFNIPRSRCAHFRAHLKAPISRAWRWGFVVLNGAVGLLLFDTPPVTPVVLENCKTKLGATLSMSLTYSELVGT